ncbi:MAG: hypothetical protein LIP01_08590 [Tannerellaceae bacterium]|nr:hypothetical protein [Tannerellaceae bacterium]
MYQKKVFISSRGDSLNYRLLRPEVEKTGLQYPLVLFLHGAGETGDDVEKVKWLGPPALIDRGRQYPFIVVSPRSAEHGWKPEFLYKLISQLKEDLRVDEDRLYLTGLSMGGYGTWATAQVYPELFAAIIPICGGGSPGMAWRISMPVWCFHGEEDDVVPFSQSQEMVDAVRGL